MTTFFLWLEQTGVGTWMRESPSMFAYTGMITLHAIGLSMAVGFSWVLALRARGVADHVPLAPLKALFPLIVVGVWLCAISGLLLGVGYATRDFGSPIFLTKMVLVVLGAYNTRVLKNSLFGPSAPTAQATALPPPVRRQATIVLAVWALAIIVGRLNEYPQLLGLRYH